MNGLLRKLSSEALTAPSFVGQWSVKDVIGHITSWEEECLRRIRRMRMGKPVDSVPEGVVSQWNREHVEAKRSRSLEQVMREFDTIHARLVQEIESIPEGELVYKEDIAEWLVGNTTEHYAEHRRALEAVMSAQRGSHREEVE